MRIDLTVPLGTLGVLETESLDSDSSVTFERRVGFRGTGSPVLKITAVDPDVIRSIIGASPAVDNLRRLSGGEPEADVLEFDWQDTLPSFLRTLDSLDATILSARATAQSWRLTLRVPDRADASVLLSETSGLARRMTVEQISRDGAIERGASSELTPAQREALELAIQRGYFEVPRQSTVEDLATEIGISDSAVSQRLRRGMASLLGASTTVNPATEARPPSKAAAGENELD